MRPRPLKEPVHKSSTPCCVNRSLLHNNSDDELNQRGLEGRDAGIRTNTAVEEQDITVFSWMQMRWTSNNIREQEKIQMEFLFPCKAHRASHRPAINYQRVDVSVFSSYLSLYLNLGFTRSTVTQKYFPSASSSSSRLTWEPGV